MRYLYISGSNGAALCTYRSNCAALPSSSCAAMCQPASWQYRWVSPKMLDLNEEDCCSTYVWQLAKPRMNEKLQKHESSGKLVPGLLETFTDDGWCSYKYELVSECLDCVLFKHIKGNNGILFKRIGGPIVTLWLGNVVENQPYVWAQLKMMTGNVLHSELMSFNETVHDFISKCMRTRECRLRFTPYDWMDKKILSPFGEEVAKGFKFHLVWHAYKVFEAGSIAHAHCGCQRSLKRQREE